jgi:hypothetical protein
MQEEGLSPGVVEVEVEEVVKVVVVVANLQNTYVLLLLE